MISRDSVQTLIGGTAYSTDGDKIGSIGQVYLDNSSGEPAWVTVKTGLFGTNESFVPLEQAELTQDGVRVPYDKDRVKGAPNIETDRELSEQEEDQLYSYYGLSGTGTTTTTSGLTEDSDRGWGAGESGYQSATTGTGTGTTGTTDYTTTESAGTTGYDSSDPSAYPARRPQRP